MDDGVSGELFSQVHLQTTTQEQTTALANLALVSTVINMTSLLCYCALMV